MTMFKVTATITQEHSDKNLILKGYSETLPKVGEFFSLYMYRDFCKIVIEFGNVFNIKEIDEELLLIQTEHKVVELLINQEIPQPKKEGKVYQFSKSEKLGAPDTKELLKLIKGASKSKKSRTPLKLV